MKHEIIYLANPIQGTITTDDGKTINVIKYGVVEYDNAPNEYLFTYLDELEKDSLLNFTFMKFLNVDILSFNLMEEFVDIIFVPLKEQPIEPIDINKYRNPSILEEYKFLDDYMEIEFKRCEDEFGKGTPNYIEGTRLILKIHNLALDYKNKNPLKPLRDILNQ